MKIAVLKERRLHERRVAASPETVKKLTALGYMLCIESGAGLTASVSDEEYKAAGASIAADVKSALKGAAIILSIQGLQDEEIALAPAGAILLGALNPYMEKAKLAALAKADLTAFAMEFVPRITRAQSMDILSSQSNLAGYKAVLDAAALYGRAFPMMMTAAGTVPPAKVLVMGAGVAGLQAIATAKRLGAIVVQQMCARQPRNRSPA